MKEDSRHLSTVETIPGGLKVCDANGQSLAYVYPRTLRSLWAAHSEQHRQAANLTLAKLEGFGRRAPYQKNWNAR